MKLPILVSSLAFLCQTALTAYFDEPLLQLAAETFESKPSLNLLLLDFASLLEQNYSTEEVCEEILRLNPDLLYLQNLPMESTAYQIYDLLAPYYPHFDADSSLSEGWMIASKSAIISPLEQDPLLQALLATPNSLFAGEINGEYLVNTAPASMWQGNPGRLASITRCTDAYALYYYSHTDLFCGDLRGNVGMEAKGDNDGNKETNARVEAQGTTDGGDNWKAGGELRYQQSPSGENKVEGRVYWERSF